MRLFVVASVVVLLVCGSPATGQAATVVIGVGETLLAGEVEAFVEKALADRGLDLVDERGFLHVEELLGDRTQAPGSAVVDALRPVADTLVLIRAEYLGDRPLYYMYRGDSAFQSRLIVSVIDLRTSRPAEPAFNERVEYTHVSVSAVAEREMQPEIGELAEILERRR